MKRYGKTEGIWERICDEKNIEEAMQMCLKQYKSHHREYTKIHKDIIEHWEEYKEFIHNNLKNETYKFGELHSFTVYDRKERIINSPSLFPDKIYLTCAYNILRDYYYKQLPTNTYNCIKGRGLYRAKTKIEGIMEKYPTWYYCKTDVKKFYDSISHNLLKKRLLKLFKDKRVLKFLFAAIDTYNFRIDEEGDEIGLAIGINLNQLNALLFLSDIMKKINNELKYPCVGFTDDIFVAVPNKEKAHEFEKWYKNELEDIKLVLKNTSYIAPMTTPLRMIGYEFRLNQEHEQYTLLGKHLKQRVKKLIRKLNKNNVSDEVWKQKIASYHGWIKNGNCKNLMKTLYGDKIKTFRKNK